MNGLQVGCRAAKQGARDRDALGLAPMFYYVQIDDKIVARHLVEIEARSMVETYNRIMARDNMTARMLPED